MTKAKIYQWGDARRINSTAGFYKRKYGRRVQKLSLDAGFTCPNRDGIRGRGGCTYCNNDAFNPSYCQPEKTIRRQLEEGIAFHKQRYRRTELYLAYFQAYSNTYASLDNLRILYEEALAVPGVIGLVISTRPDCVDEEKLDYLAELQKKTFVAVEYGIESCYNKTLERINRGHAFEDAVDAVQQTAARDLRTTAHLIFGLPGESRDEMLSEAGILSRLPLNAIKFHQLQIVKGTMMAKQYGEHPERFALFSYEEYIPFMVSFLERLHPDIQVDRMTGETPPGYLIAPDWGKKRAYEIQDEIYAYMEKNDTWQGRYFVAPLKQYS
jgi:uncharacterized protein